MEKQKEVRVITKRPNGTRRVQTFFHDPSKADQTMKDECDVNNIMDRFMKTGQITHLKSKQGQFADVSEYGDLFETTLKVQEAEKAFMALPSQLRKKLNNDPRELPNYLSDPKNRDEAIKYGLIEAGELPARSKQAEGAQEEDPKKTKTTKTKTEPPKNDDD